MSMSGIDARSGLRKRSNSSPCSIGSMSVMPQRIGDQRARRRAAARPHPDVDRPGVADQVGDDQEVGREALVADDLDLVGGPVDVLAGRRRSGTGAAARRRTSWRSQDAWSWPSGTGKTGIRSRGCPHVGVGLHPLGDQQGRVAGAGTCVVPDLRASRRRTSGSSRRRRT